MGKRNASRASQTGIARLASSLFSNEAGPSTGSISTITHIKDETQTGSKTAGAPSSLDISSVLEKNSTDDETSYAGFPLEFSSSKKIRQSADSGSPAHTSTAPAGSKPARKRRKTNRGGAIPAYSQRGYEDEEFTTTEYPEGWVPKYNASALGVEHYTNASQVPEDLQKYFSQRYRLLSLYSSYPGCLLDREGWYSITPEAIAHQIAERCRCDTILDAFCGVGGNAIAFAITCERVIALDTSPTRLALARHNAQIYGVADRIEFILGDYLSFARSYADRRAQGIRERSIDVVFLSPPWGGIEYQHAVKGKGKAVPSTTEDTGTTETEYAEYSLSSIQPIHGKQLFDLTRQITHNIAYFLPRNTRLEEVGALVGPGSNPVPGAPSISVLVKATEDGSDDADKQGQGTGDHSPEMVEVEEEWMGQKLKALTCYFGGLVQGQEDRF